MIRRLEPCWADEWVHYTLPRLIYAGPQLDARSFGTIAPDVWNESYVYHLFDDLGELVYVGFTGTPKTRWEHHARKAAWWTSATQLNAYSVRGTDWNCANIGARRWESLAINKALPRENKHGPANLPSKRRRAV